MNFNPNLENIQNLCRICLKDGDVNIWNCKVSLKQHDTKVFEYNCEDTAEKSFVEMMSVFFNSQDLLNLTEEFPLLCLQCFEDLKFCYSVYEKIKLANVQLINLYEESLNQYIEEEHLVETVEENEENCLESSNIAETVIQYSADNVSELPSNKLKHITLDNNSSFIVTQFVPETIVPANSFSTDLSKSNDEVSRHPMKLLTVNLKAVEVQNLENTDRVKSPEHLITDNTESSIYVCQYCPQAFTKSEYLKTHIQKSHVCKFCTQPFNATEDLFRHIREVHTENKCAICHKLFSSSTNLRHHIKGVHGVKLPAKVTLIDFIQSSTLEEKSNINETELFEEVQNPDIEYLWQSEDCIDMLNEYKSSMS